MKKIISILLCIMMLAMSLARLPISASAQATPLSSLDGDTVSAGGTYSISTAAELQKFASLCTAANNWCAGVTFVITEDIDLNEGWTASATAPTGSGAVIWTPIPLFSGVLDGQEHTVSGFYINGGLDWKDVLDTSSSISGAEKAAGIFCSLGGENTEVKNLNITNSYIRSEKMVGTVAGVISNETSSNSGLKISNVSSSATVVSDDSNAGGIIGVINAPQTSYSITLDDCTFSGNVSVAKNNVGGMVGVTWKPTVITDCTNTGAVWSKNENGAVNMGGMIGYYTGGHGKLTMERCVNKGTIYTETSLSHVNGGGMIGFTEYSVTVSDCVNVGSIELRRSTANAEYVAGGCSIGGIIGSKKDTQSTVVLSLVRCANFGAVTLIPNTSTTVVETGSGVGGLIGKVLDGAPLSLTDCVSSGTLTAGRSIVGGIVGTCFVATGSFTRCVFLGDFDGGNDFYSGGLVGNVNYTGTNTANKLTFTDCAYAAQSFTNYVNNKSVALNSVGNYVAADTCKRNIDVYVTGTATPYKVTPTELNGNYSANLTALNLPFVNAQCSKASTALMGNNAKTTLSAFDFTTAWTTLADIPVPTSVSALVTTADIPAIGDDNIQSGGTSGGTSGGGSTGSEQQPSGGEDSGNNTQTQLPDTFDPSLIIGSKKEDTDTDASVDTTEQTTTEPEETTQAADDGGCGSNITLGGIALMGIVLAVVFVAGKKKSNSKCV